MSIMQLEEPLVLTDEFDLRVIELIPPEHRRVYKMGMEHFGVVIGDSVDEFSIRHRPALTGQQFQSKECEPYYVTFFEDFSSVKFYRNPYLREIEGFHSWRHFVVHQDRAWLLNALDKIQNQVEKIRDAAGEATEVEVNELLGMFEKERLSHLGDEEK